MNYHISHNENQATLYIEGMLDTNTSANLTEQLLPEIGDPSEVEQLCVDAAKLTYIASSGLRVMLSLAKTYTNFSINNTTPEVYEIFEVTGFTKIMNVNKALRTIQIDGCDEIGKGGVGTVYRIDDETIIKVFREGTTLKEVETEISMAKEAFILGMPTAISYDIVKVNNSYGLIYELLKAKTLSTCINDNPENIDAYAKEYANLFKQLHDIKVPSTSKIPNAKENVEKAIMHISKYFDEDDIECMKYIAKSIPDEDRLLHLDLQTKNAMMQNEELMLIDMGEIGKGHPMVDLAHSYSAMMTLNGDYRQIIGMSEELSHKAWTKMIDYYFEDINETEKQHRIEQIRTVSTLRGVTWLALSDSFPQEIIQMCKQNFKQRVTNQRDYIYKICDTLNDWKLE